MSFISHDMSHVNQNKSTYKVYEEKTYKNMKNNQDFYYVNFSFSIHILLLFYESK